MNTAEILFVVGRILFGGYFFWNGLNHIIKNRVLAGYAQSKGVPAPRFMVYFSGLFIFLGGLGVLLGAYMEWSAALIAIFLVVVSFKMHNFWAMTDPMQKMMEMVQFTKNMALLGAALMLAALPPLGPTILSDY